MRREIRAKTTSKKVVSKQLWGTPRNFAHKTCNDNAKSMQATTQKLNWVIMQNKYIYLKQLVEERQYLNPGYCVATVCHLTRRRFLVRNCDLLNNGRTNLYFHQNLYLLGYYGNKSRKQQLVLSPQFGKIFKKKQFCSKNTLTTFRKWNTFFFSAAERYIPTHCIMCI